MLRLLSILVLCFIVVKARDMAKTLRTMPIVTNSLLNLGKMDISFYLNARPQDLPKKSEIPNFGSSSFFGPKSESLNIEPCPCSGLRDSAQNHPADLIGKILSGNDFFSFKEPESSTLCCDSHEHVQEDILLEFSPKQTQIVSNSQNPFPLLPFLLQNMHSKPTLPKTASKPKAIEILFYPKNKQLPNLNSFFNKGQEIAKKDNIKIVGDKEIRNDFKANQFVPPLPSSVKKELNSQDNIAKQVTDKVMKTRITIDNKSNIV